MSDASALLSLSPERRDKVLRRSNPGVWAERARRQTHADFHWEWYRLLVKWPRLCLVAPREHAKTESVTINYSIWRMRYWPGTQLWVFTGTDDLGEELKKRIDEAVEEAEPEMWAARKKPEETKETTYGNGSSVKTAGAGKTIRGPHPDVIIGDDVLDEKKCQTRLQRDRTKKWWIGTVGPMAHGGTVRRVGGRRYAIPPTRIALMGTPFHADDLLMSLRHNPQYHWRRYASEFDDEHLPLEGSLAVEVG